MPDDMHAPDDTPASGRAAVSGAVLGAVIAGGASKRYGAPKALALVAGQRVVDRVTAALRAVVGDDIIVIANDAALAGEIGLAWQGDIIANVGALAGVHSALVMAEQQGYRGVLAVACDMPFVDPRLLQELLDRSHDTDVVLPESLGRRQVEPLCAYYSTACVDPIERAAARGDGRMIAFHGDVRVARVPLSVVRSIGEPDVLFQNLNTPADRERAERLAAGGA